MELKDIGLYLLFHAPFIVLASVIWTKCENRLVARRVAAGLILSHLLSLAAYFILHDDDPPRIHLFALYAVAPPVAAWVFVVLPKAERPLRKVLSSVIVGYVAEVAVFIVTVIIALFIEPIDFR